MGCGGSSRCRCGCFRCYTSRVFPVTYNNTVQTFLEFDYPANALPLGGILRMHFTFRAFNNSGGPVQPFIQLDWGTNSIAFAAGQIGTWLSSAVFNPYQIWAFEIMRVGNLADPTDPSGTYAIQQPFGYEPAVSPFYDPHDFPAILQADTDFTIDQTPRLAVNWGIGADNTVKLNPLIANVHSWGTVA